nr:uncharacterized protein CI109_002017 [Kwoniella shandongensis]KAA5529592.1 hypothetical protein CI109_002017 [Kwoniella shandongensis]
MNSSDGGSFGSASPIIGPDDQSSVKRALSALSTYSFSDNSNDHSITFGPIESTSSAHSYTSSERRRTPSGSPPIGFGGLSATSRDASPQGHPAEDAKVASSKSVSPQPQVQVAVAAVDTQSVSPQPQGQAQAPGPALASIDSLVFNGSTEKPQSHVNGNSTDFKVAQNPSHPAAQVGHDQDHIDPSLRDDPSATQNDLHIQAPVQGPVQTFADIQAQADHQLGLTTARPLSQSQDQAQGQLHSDDQAAVKSWADFPHLPDHFTTSNPNPSAKTPWQLQTSFPESQPPSSVNSGVDSAPTSPGPWSGYDSSMADLGRTPGHGMSAASSESGFEMGSASASGGEQVPAPKKKSHARKQPEGHIKRARNAFILFRKHVTDSNLIPPSVEAKHQNISVVVAKMWKEAPQDVRARFQNEARIEKEEHQRKYPGYRYQPVFRRTDIIRRRVRKDPTEDEKVEAVAEALIKGKAGGELEKEIKETLVGKSEGSESEAESSKGGSGTSRRRRRETGQLSKGAIRAQRAQARAKAMRQNLLGSNLLSMSLYNAANTRLQQAAAAQAAVAAQQQQQAAAYAGRTHPGMQYAMTDQNYHLPLGYGMDGRPLQLPAPALPPAGGGAGGYAGGQQQQDMYSVGGGQREHEMEMEMEMYRLPPIQGMMADPGAGMTNNDPNGSYDWSTAPVADQGGMMDYWDAPQAGMQTLPHQQEYEAQQGIPGNDDYYGHPGGGYDLDGGVGGGVGELAMDMGGFGSGMEYRLPPLLETGSRELDASGSSNHGGSISGSGDYHRPGDLIAGEYSRELGLGNQADGNSHQGEDDARLQEWVRDGQQTPSGHVQFNERLFDGALGSAGFGMGMSIEGIGALPLDRRDGEGDDGLGMFGEAIEQAGQVGDW